MTDDMRETLSKVPAVTLSFWVIKILATTLGETGGDAVTMSWLGETTPEAGAAGMSGYLIGTFIFLIPLILLVIAQIRAKRFHPLLYWATIIASTTAGTTMADFADRSLGIGYTGGTAALLVCVLGSLAAWKLTLGSVSSDNIQSPSAEAFYWLTITFSQTLGTALGDWAADDGGLGYLGGATVFGGALAVVALLYFTTRLNRITLFWAAFILTRPLGATVGDFLDKPFASGGLNLSRPLATSALVIVMFVLILVLPQRGYARNPASD